MAIERIRYESEKEWLEARTKDVTSTDVAALPSFDASPYKSPWQLFMEKLSGEVQEIVPSERMMWGSRLQDAVARGVAEDTGLTVRRLNTYIRDPVQRVGSSFDFEVVSHEDGPGIMEIKNVDSMIFRNNWVEENGRLEAPPHLELQLQHQLLVSQRSWGMLVALVGGNTIKIARRERDEEVGKIILKKVAEFWVMVRENRPPPPDFTRDAKAIARLYSKTEPGLILDATQNTELEFMVMDYKQVNEERKALDNIMDEAKARILERIGKAEKVLGNGWSISAKEVKESQGKLITPDMVGTYTGARKGYRRFDVNIKREG
jgi:putative phage-type endonuclease